MYFSHVEKKLHDTRAVKPVDRLFCDITVYSLFFLSHIQLFQDSDSAFLFVLTDSLPSVFSYKHSVFLWASTRHKSEVLIIHAN